MAVSSVSVSVCMRTQACVCVCVRMCVLTDWVFIVEMEMATNLDIATLSGFCLLLYQSVIFFWTRVAIMYIV
uniref:Uncharacterized protein n=1 Tax=Anguilla anguilla TaxID=7936 RepID=A0A0E9PAA6_ANGAN